MTDKCECGDPLTDKDELAWGMCIACYDYAGDHADYYSNRLGSTLDNPPVSEDRMYDG